MVYKILPLLINYRNYTIIQITKDCKSVDLAGTGISMLREGIKVRAQRGSKIDEFRSPLHRDRMI